MVLLDDEEEGGARMRSTGVMAVTPWLALGSAVAMVVSSAASVLAAPLAKDACTALQAEQTGLVGKGLREDLAKGPEWGRASLDSGRLAMVARLIEVDEQILFRCAVRPSEEAAQKAAAAKDEKGTAAGRLAPQSGTESGQKAAKQKRPAKAKQAPQKAAGQSAESDEDEEAEVKAQPKRKRAVAKQKVRETPPANDAYVPPAGPPQSVLTPPKPAAPAALQ